jgi:hypothetical protein
MRLKKVPTGVFVLAGLAAFVYYKYSKLSEEEKNTLVADLKETGRIVYDQFVPDGLKNLFSKKNNMGYDYGDYDFGEHSDYSF